MLLMSIYNSLTRDRRGSVIFPVIDGFSELMRSCHNILSRQFVNGFNAKDPAGYR